MKISDVSFPYPVLGIGDDVMPLPGIKYRFNSNKSSYIVDFDITMENEDITRLISEGYAEYKCEVDCALTNNRFAIASQTPSFHIELPRTDVAGRVNFQCTITAIKEIADYNNKGFHPDYVGYHFQIEPGEILAYIGDLHYDADIEYDKLRSAGSFMTIVEGHDPKNTIYYLENDKIEVQLPPEMYQDYKENFNKNKKLANIFHSSIVFNALVYAISMYDEELHQDKLWARTIGYRIQIEKPLQPFKETMIEKDGMDVLKLAQALLGNPYARLFSSMHELMNQQIIEEEED